MLKKLVSFGFKHGAPEEGRVIDVRALFPHDPFFDPSLRKLRGTHSEVQAEIRKAPDFAEKYAILKQQVVDSDAEIVCIGCGAGHHRAVFLAEMLSADLNVPVHHRDINRGKTIKGAR